MSLHRFTERIESLFTKIFLINLNLNMIAGSLTGIQVRINKYINTVEPQLSDLIGIRIRSNNRENQI